MSDSVLPPDPLQPAAAAALAQQAEIDRLRNEVVKLQAALLTVDRVHADQLARLSHQLRGPLSPIMTALELLKTSTPADTPRLAVVIGRQIKDLIRIVDGIGQAPVPPA